LVQAKGLTLFIVVVDEGVDMGAQLFDGLERGTFERVSGDTRALSVPLLTTVGSPPGIQAIRDQLLPLSLRMCVLGTMPMTRAMWSRCIRSTMTTFQSVLPWTTIRA
jgi:hypothetical protein